MKLRNVSNLAVQVFDEHAVRGALVEPGGETFELSELAYAELSQHTEVWKPAADATEKPTVRTSGQKKGK